MTSDCPPAASWTGQFSDGLDATTRVVEVGVTDLHLYVFDEPLVHIVPLAQVRASPRLGKLPRTLALPDIGIVVLADTEALSHQLGEKPSYLTRMESATHFAVPTLLLLIAGCWALYAAALPWLADTVARQLSGAWESKYSGDTLARLDATVLWKRSALDPGKQDKLRAHLLGHLQPESIDPSHIHFRSSVQLGPNAVALAGGDVVFTDALVELLTPDELVGVYAHELGHVHHRHVVRSEMREAGLRGMINLITGFGALNASVASTASAWGLTHYSREFETEADMYAFNLLRATNQSPCLLVSALQKLQRTGEPREDSETSWFSTHPPTHVRVDMAGLACQSP